MVVTKVCRNCNKPFDVEFFKRKQQFCSTSCRIDHLKNQSMGRSTITWRGKKNIRQKFDSCCAFCGMHSDNFAYMKTERINLRVHKTKYIKGFYITLCPICYKYYQLNPEMYEALFVRDFTGHDLDDIEGEVEIKHSVELKSNCQGDGIKVGDMQLTTNKFNKQLME